MRERERERACACERVWWSVCERVVYMFGWMDVVVVAAAVVCVCARTRVLSEMMLSTRWRVIFWVKIVEVDVLTKGLVERERQQSTCGRQ